jgi:hypothetical protein
MKIFSIFSIIALLLFCFALTVERQQYPADDVQVSCVQCVTQTNIEDNHNAATHGTVCSSSKQEATSGYVQSDGEVTDDFSSLIAVHSCTPCYNCTSSHVTTKETGHSPTGWKEARVLYAPPNAPAYTDAIVGQPKAASRASGKALRLLTYSGRV